MKTIVLSFLLFFSLAANATTLILIGGGNHPESAIKRLVQEARGKAIWVLPWGTTETAETFKQLKDEFFAAGATQVQAALSPRLTGYERAQLKLKLKSAGAIFFPGGDQSVLMQNLKEQELVPLLRDLYFSGVVFGGTSAGTAIQSELMFNGSGTDASPGLEPGLGALKRFLIDQHFIKRARESRMIAGLGEINQRNWIGVGVDEDMSVIVTNNSKFQAMGPSKVQFFRLKQGKKPTDLDAYAKTELSDGETVIY